MQRPRQNLINDLETAVRDLEWFERRLARLRDGSWPEYCRKSVEVSLHTAKLACQEASVYLRD